MADVFVSYAREALPFVRRLTAALRARDREVWVDLEGIIPSARWMEGIRTGITEADAVVFVITPEWVASKVCRAELDFAIEQSKRLVPVLARETTNGTMPSELAELHWLRFADGTDYEAGVDQLVEVLDTDLPRARLHTRLLVQAREWETRDRDPSLLLRGEELKQAETWLADQTGRKPAATPAQAQLILASRRAATRRQRGFGATAVAVAFSPDGHTLATGSVDHTAKLWDVTTHQLLATLTGHTNNVNGVVFGSDGRLATGSADHTIRLWDLDTARVTNRLCHTIGAPSQADWARFIPDLPYQPTCHQGN